MELSMQSDPRDITEAFVGLVCHPDFFKSNFGDNQRNLSKNWALGDIL